MGLFKKKNKVVDLTERYRRQQEKLEEIKADMKETNSVNTDSGIGNFFGNMANIGAKNSSSEESVNSFESPEEKRRKFTKRLLEITERLENLSNQIYHLQQRVEVLEKKSNINNF